MNRQEAFTSGDKRSIATDVGELIINQMRTIGDRRYRTAASLEQSEQAVKRIRLSSLQKRWCSELLKTLHNLCRKPLVRKSTTFHGFAGLSQAGQTRIGFISSTFQSLKFNRWSPIASSNPRDVETSNRKRLNPLLGSVRAF